MVICRSFSCINFDGKLRLAPTSDGALTA